MEADEGVADIVEAADINDLVEAPTAGKAIVTSILMEWSNGGYTRN